MFFHYKSERVVLKIEVPPLSGPRRYVHFGVCAPQSASFALATTRPPDGLLNASRPTTQLRTILYKSTRRSRGRQDAIDFVAIALPSLRSLRHSHRRVSSSCYVTRSRTKIIPTRPLTCTAHTRLTHDENKRTDAGVAKMKAQFSSCGKRSTKNQSEQLQPVAVGAMGLVCDEFGAHRLAALRLEFRLRILFAQ